MRQRTLENSFSKFSALEYLLSKVTTQRTFQQCHRYHASGLFRSAQLLCLALELVHFRRELVQCRREAILWDKSKYKIDTVPDYRGAIVRHGVCVSVCLFVCLSVCVCVCLCVRVCVLSAYPSCLATSKASRHGAHVCVYAYPSAACC